MKSTKIIFILFLMVALAQIAAPTKMIYDQEKTIEIGKPYKFLTQPLDPNDPFRGKFVRLNYEIRRFKTQDSIWNRNEEIFVYLKDSLGFAKIETVSKEKLPIKNDYVKAKAIYYKKYNNTLEFNLPFDRFYMEESKAKPAEDLVRRNRRDSINLNTTYALVYVDKGNFVLHNVFINDIPIKDTIKNLNK
ncbi:MAG: GDYXXLXY domain-containing protein [Polaribacter sp.]